jgi:putative hydrolase of the HAD superfamily
MKVLDLKMKKTNLGKYFDACITSFDLGHPKEDLQFWEKARERLGFDNERTLFIDDTLEILKTAEAFGIRYILYKAKANAKVTPRRPGGFPAITDFKELLYEGI